MNATYLTRIDGQAHMARFYRLELAPTLFGDWCLVREWGRIGRSGQVKHDWFTDKLAASKAQASLIRRKMKRGYLRS